MKLFSGKRCRWRTEHECRDNVGWTGVPSICCRTEIPILQGAGSRRRQRRKVVQSRDIGDVAIRIQLNVQDHRSLGFRLGRIWRKMGRVQLRWKKGRVLLRDGLNLRRRRQRNIVRSKKAGVVHDIDRKRGCHWLSIQHSRRIRPRAHRRPACADTEEMFLRISTPVT